MAFLLWDDPDRNNDPRSLTDHNASNELNNPVWTRIHRSLRGTTTSVILDNHS